MDPALLVATAGEVEGQLGEVGRTHGLLLVIAGLQELPNTPMQASTPGGADFGIEALTDFIVTEEEASGLLGPHEPSALRRKETLLHRFELLPFHPGEQRGLKAASDDRGNPQVINHSGSQPREPLVQRPNNAGRQRLLERRDGSPLLVFQDKGTGLDPALEEFLGKEGIPLALCMQEHVHARAERSAKSALGKRPDLCNREGTDDERREHALTG